MNRAAFRAGNNCLQDGSPRLSTGDGLPRLSCHTVKNGEPDTMTMYLFAKRTESYRLMIVICNNFICAKYSLHFTVQNDASEIDRLQMFKLHSKL